MLAAHPHRLREVGPQPRPPRGRHRARATAPRPCTSRRWRSTRCWTRCARPTRRSPGSRVPRAAAGSTSAVLEKVQRFWGSDMTDAVSRQQIQRWTTQLVAPELVGAHVSSPVSHTTGRHLSLDFRAATALFCSFGVEWDLLQADDADLRAARRLGGAVPPVPADAPLGPVGPPGLLRPGGPAARGGRGGPRRGAGRARPDGRVGAQPRSDRAGPGTRPRGDVPAALGGADGPRPP